MPKVLGQAGTSLADVYDVEGSIAGVETLESGDVQLRHEMGATIFSERLVGEVQRFTTGAIAQNINFDVVQQVGGIAVARITQVAVIVDADRIDFCSIAIRDDDNGREVPLWVWDTAIDGVSDIRIQENGQTVGNVLALRQIDQASVNAACLQLGLAQPRRLGHVAFRGRTTGFGAGTVTATGIVTVYSAESQGLSSHGLPVPSW